MQAALIFDMDGTLVDTKRDIALTINAIREANYGLPPLSESAITSMMNRTGLNLAKAFYGVERYSHKDRTAFEAFYMEQCTRHSRIYEGIVELLETLTHSRCMLYVATNAPSRGARKILHHHGLGGYFQAILGSDDVELPKPHPQMLHTIRNLASHAGGTRQWYMVGDSHKDMLAALDADMTPIAAHWGYGFCTLPEEAHSVQVPREIVDLLFKGGQKE